VATSNWEFTARASANGAIRSILSTGAVGDYDQALAEMAAMGRWRSHHSTSGEPLDSRVQTNLGRWLLQINKVKLHTITGCSSVC